MWFVIDCGDKMLSWTLLIQVKVENKNYKKINWRCEPSYQLLEDILNTAMNKKTVGLELKVVYSQSLALLKFWTIYLAVLTYWGKLMQQKYKVVNISPVNYNKTVRVTKMSHASQEDSIWVFHSYLYWVQVSVHWGGMVWYWHCEGSGNSLPIQKDLLTGGTISDNNHSWSCHPMSWTQRKEESDNNINDL